MSSDPQAHREDPEEFARPSVPWARGAPGIEGVLERWRGEARWRNVALHHVVPARAARPVEPPGALHPAVRQALARRGVEQLYSHQAQAFDLVRAGKNVVVATPTASGKSLCYHLPLLDRLAREPGARALFLFPTKALSRDQEASLRALLREAELPGAPITYDGDTPGELRRSAREESAVVLTNPDMLHAGILPHHASWARFFAQLRLVVVDELHSYRGVFGSHLANVLRRLRRIARFHGAEPTFVLASATIGNPREHAERMLGAPVELLDESGAPSGERHVLVYDPPVVHAELGVRASYVKTAVALTGDLVAAGVPTLLFGQSRNNVEVMLKYLRERLASERLDPASVEGYRSGYLPATRRRIEEGLRQGQIRGVVATNALELGIDVGSLGAVVSAGYPGSLAALWQRFGRAGRRNEPALALLVASGHPLDQYVAREPGLVIGAPIEHARIDPDNVEILVEHVKCAAFELPFEEGEGLGDVPGPAVGQVLEHLEKHRLVHRGGPLPSTSGGGARYHWASEAYPAAHVSLRSLGWDNFVVVDLEADRTIAEMDWRSTHTMLHEQAIYQHEGEQFQVERLDFENHKAFVRKVEPDYYTTALTHTRIAVVQEDATEPALAAGTPGDAHAAGDALLAGLGEISVVEKVVGYKKIKFHTHENVGYGDVRLPEMQMHTSAMWLAFPEAALAGLGVPRAVALDAVRAIGNALHVVAAVGLMCDPRDLGVASGDAHERATLYLYDHVPGGIGLCPRLFSDRASLLRRARSSIERCACDGGCPACVGVVIDRKSLPKRLALALLEACGVEAVH